MNQRLISLKNITKTYNDKKIFINASFDILEGQNVCFLGLNGMGKTTLLKIIANLEKKSSGNIWYSPSIFNKYFANIDFVPQYSIYNRNDTVKNYIELFCGLYGFKFQDIHTNELYNFFEIKKYISSKFVKLSGGQKKIIEIFCALFHNPKVIIFDELLKELDMNKQKLYLEFIKEYCHRNRITILFSAHNVLEVELLADKILLIENQKITITELPLSSNERTQKIRQIVEKMFADKINKGFF